MSLGTSWRTSLCPSYPRVVLLSVSVELLLSYCLKEEEEEEKNQIFASVSGSDPRAAERARAADTGTPLPPRVPEPEPRPQGARTHIHTHTHTHTDRDFTHRCAQLTCGQAEPAGREQRKEEQAAHIQHGEHSSLSLPPSLSNFFSLSLSLSPSPSLSLSLSLSLSPRSWCCCDVVSSVLGYKLRTARRKEFKE